MTWLHWLAAGGGLGVGLAVALLVWQLGRQRRRAEVAEADADTLGSLADDRRRQLARVEEVLRVARADLDRLRAARAEQARRDPALARDLLRDELRLGEDLGEAAGAVPGGRAPADPERGQRGGGD